MEKTIGVSELRLRLPAVLEEVSTQHTAYVLTRGKRPQAAFVPYEEFRRFRTFREGEVARRFDRLLERMAENNARFSEQEVADDVAATLAELGGREVDPLGYGSGG